ncbi:hypothetical protein IMSAGC022_00998 [Alistipes sp.]|nr:hypothetical protein IMSAGC022_00998 [Alistipes sp.]
MYPVTGSKHLIRFFQAIPPFIDGICTDGITLCLAITESRIICFY